MNFRQVHLDFHTSEKIDNIGSKFDKKQFQEALIAGHVNSITVFSKCHHGYAYHPSMENEMHPGLKFDLLKAQIDAAHEIGVKTPVYLSVGYDEKVVRRHPNWRFEPKDHYFDNFDFPRYHTMCLNTPYLDYILAQIKEAAELYDADGIFLDIVGVRPCCCSTCMKSMLDRGMDPNNDDDIIKMGEIVYKNYLKKVRETIDSVKPGLPVFHNGGHIRQGRRDLAYGNTHLELESLPTGGWGYDHFPLSGKYAQNLGMEYLGMTGKFHTSWGEFGGYKHPNALRYEVSLSAAMGAKCSIGDQLAPDGHMDMTTYELIGAAYGELEQKEEWLDKVTPVCDVAVLSVESSLNETGNAPAAARNQIADIGAGRMLLEGKYMFTVIDSQVDFDNYKVIVLPDNYFMTDEVKSRLIKFINGGGKLLASGSSVIDENGFVLDFGAEYEGEGEFVPSYVRPVDNNPNEADYIMYGPYKKIRKTNGAELAKVSEPYFNRTAKHYCSHKHAPSSGKYGGAGAICGRCGIYIAWDIFTDYAENGELIAKRLVCDALDILLCGAKALVTDLGSMGVASLMEQKEENRLVAHLLYAVPTKRGKSVEIIEDIYPVYNTELAVKMDEAPKKVYLAPQKEEIPFTYEKGYAKVNVEKIDCHQMVIFDK